MHAARPPFSVLLVNGSEIGGALARAIPARFGDALGTRHVLMPTAGAPRWSGPAAANGWAPSVPRIGLPESESDLDALIADTESVIDATDPFDQGTWQRLRQSAGRTGRPWLAARSPVWERHPLDRWVEMRDLAGAVGAVASLGRVALLALPPDEIAAFEPVGGLAFPVRLTHPTRLPPLPARFYPVEAPVPTHLARELHLLRETGAQVVVMRATGSAVDAPLVEAARRLDLPILMIRRPLERGVRPARSVEAALDWLERIAGLDGGTGLNRNRAGH